MSHPPGEKTAHAPVPERPRGRSGRLTHGQGRALRELWPRYGLEYAPTPIDAEAVFSRRAPLWLDIGSGTGDSSIGLARTHPDRDFLALEPYPPGVGRLLRRLEEERLENVRVMRCTAREILERPLSGVHLERVLILFPDPWPKRRHHKRRLVNDAFLRLLAGRLAPHGRVHIATDCAEYAQNMLKALAAVPELANLAGTGRYAPRPRWRPRTKYEAAALAARRRVYELLLAHVPDSC